jgi:hypothetical protein
VNAPPRVPVDPSQITPVDMAIPDGQASRDLARLLTDPQTELGKPQGLTCSRRINSMSWLYGSGPCLIGGCQDTSVDFQSLCERHGVDPLWESFGSLGECRVIHCPEPMYDVTGLCADHDMQGDLVFKSPLRGKPMTDPFQPEVDLVLRQIAAVERGEVSEEWARAYLTSQSPQ